VKTIEKTSKKISDQNLRQQLNKINTAMEQIRKKLEKDYGVSPLNYCDD
jgi:hypothetical protein